MTCDETPDLGANSGVGGYSWDNSNLYQKEINITCPPGKAFDTIYEKSVINNCTSQSSSETGIRWKYNENNTLTTCIRKFTFLNSFLFQHDFETYQCQFFPSLLSSF